MTDLLVPTNLLFSQEHEWIKTFKNKAQIGISFHAQKSLGDIVYVELPKVGQEITQGAPIGVLESVKAVSDLYAPISGIVTKINQNVIDDPSIINQDSYGDGWLLELDIIDSSQNLNLLDSQAYKKLLAQEAK